MRRYISYEKHYRGDNKIVKAKYVVKVTDKATELRKFYKEDVEYLDIYDKPYIMKNVSGI